MSTKMSGGAKGVLLGVGAYVATIAVAAFTSLAIMMLMKPYSCSEMGRALLVLWGTIAAVFLASVAVVGVGAWKIIAAVAARWAIVILYGAVMLASYIAIAFGLMVGFNC